MLYIIIPVFNRIAFTTACLDSLSRQTYRDFKIIVVDDGSTDGTAEILSRDYSDVIVLQGDGSLWWTASVNMGIRYALEGGATRILTLNNDTIAAEDFVEEMIRWSDKKPDALLGAFAVNAQTRAAEFGGERINWLWSNTTSVLHTVPEEQRTGLHEVTHFPGRGLLIPAEVFSKIGLFDEKRLPHYYADFDFTCRASRKGFKVFCNYDAKLLTYPEESGDAKNRINKSLKNYYNHLFGIKGGGNLKNFINFSLRNCPKKYLPFYLTFGISRRVFGYLIK